MIELENISKYYEMGDETVHALQDVSLKIDDGEYVAIIGPSGSGKSTLMNILGCLDIPTAGSYRLNGELVSDLHETQLATVRNKHIGLVFQQFNLLGKASAIRNVELPARYGGVKPAERHKRAVNAMTSVGLANRLHHKPTELSGGQQQRVAIARALVNQPTILLADEPTGALDSKTGKEILDLFEQLQRERQITVIVITHDPNVARRARRVITIRDGRIESDISRQVGKDGTETLVARELTKLAAPQENGSEIPEYTDVMDVTNGKVKTAEPVPFKRIALMAVLAIVIAAVVNIVIGQLTALMFSLQAPMLQPTLIAGFTAALILLAAVVYALVSRVAKSPTKLFRTIALVAMVISLLPDVGFVLGLVNPYAIVGGFQRVNASAAATTGAARGGGFRAPGLGFLGGGGGNASANNAALANRSPWPLAVSLGSMNVLSAAIAYSMLTRKQAKKKIKARI
jgi:putative ABC transport system ATP-binding protein